MPHLADHLKLTNAFRIQSQYGSSPHASRLADPLNLDGDFDFEFPHLRHGGLDGDGGVRGSRFGLQRGLPQEDEDADAEVVDLDDEIEDADAASESGVSDDAEDDNGEVSRAGSEMMSEAGDASAAAEEPGGRRYHALPGDGGAYM